jgi:hypothetical protein
MAEEAHRGVPQSLHISKISIRRPRFIYLYLPAFDYTPFPLLRLSQVYSQARSISRFTAFSKLHGKKIRLSAPKTQTARTN